MRKARGEGVQERDRGIILRRAPPYLQQQLLESCHTPGTACEAQVAGGQGRTNTPVTAGELQSCHLGPKPVLKVREVMVNRGRW